MFKIKLFDRTNLKDLGDMKVKEVPQRGVNIILPGTPDGRYQVSTVNNDLRNNGIDFVLYVVPKKILKEKTTP